MTLLVSIPEALKTTLNTLSTAGTLTPSFTAARSNVGPRYSRDELATIRVTTVPKSCKRLEPGTTRHKTMYEVEVYVGVQKELTSDDNSESDTLVGLCEQIAGYLNDHPEISAGVKCMGADFGADADTPFLGIQEQKEYLLYTGTLVATFRVFQ